jgi:signal transduction histidine kinase
MGERVLKRGMNLCLETENREYEAIMSLTLSKIKEAENDYPSALADFKKYYTINDSLFSQDKKNQLAALESRDKMDLKDKALAISKLELAGQRRTLVAMMMGILLLAIIGILLVRQNRIRKKSNTMLMVLNSRLDEANKLKAKFFGILSHDLRSPIANLVNYLYLLKNEPEQLSKEDNITSQLQISQSAEDLLRTMETMLLWSKEQMDQFRPDIKIIPVHILFDHIRSFSPSPRHTTIVLSNPDNLDISADENYIKVIMQNLTSNALKALKNHSQGLIEWKARRNGNHTVLSITDNGPGIHADQIKAFYSDDTVINSNTGFGFRIIRDLAEAIHYTISIESLAGTGTTFTLTNSL